MPELPEVETVRRGLAPLSSAARIAERRGAPAGPALSRCPTRFAERLTGRRVDGACAGAPNICWPISIPARRWSCIWACPARSASRATSRSASSIIRAAKTPTHDHVVFAVRERRARHLQRSAPLRLHGHRRDRAGSRRIRCSPASASSRSAPDFDAAALARAARRRARAAEGRPARPAPHRRARQHLCLRGAASRRGCRRCARRARSKPRRDAPRSPAAIREVLEAAIEAGGSTLRDHRQTDGDARLFPAFLRRLRPRGRGLRPCALRRDHHAHGAIRPLDLLLRRLSEVTRTRGRPARFRAAGQCAGIIAATL